MSFSVPTFNLTCDIYTGPWVGKVLRHLSVPCNLAWGRRSQNNFAPGLGSVELGGVSSLLLPAGTDIRDASCASGWDVVEVPEASGRFYAISAVDDVGKGFVNEYRIATMAKACQAFDAVLFPGVSWPTPIP